MSDMTSGKPLKKTEKTKENIVFKQCKINDYDAMIDETLKAMDRVLERREADLTRWGDKEKNEFSTIFGRKGEDKIKVNMPIRGKENIVIMEARDIMKDCVRRIKYVRSTMSTKDFINKINDPKREVCAKVPGEPQSDYKVEIGINFVGRRKKDGATANRICLNVTGPDSRVSTLCHELSHIPKLWTNPSGGGMGTSDYNSKGEKQSPFDDDKDSYEEHVIGANKLIKDLSDSVFDNAYNIERYFEIKI